MLTQHIRARTTLMIVQNPWKHSLRVRGFKVTHEEHDYLLLLAWAAAIAGPSDC